LPKTQPGKTVVSEPVVKGIAGDPNEALGTVMGVEVAWARGAKSSAMARRKWMRGDDVVDFFI